MVIGLIIAAVLIGAIIGLVYYAVINKHAEKICVALAVISLATLLLIPPSFHTVNTGSVAVVKRLGEAKKTRSAGTYFDFWITNTYQKYDAKVQNVDIATAAYSSDAQTMDIQMILIYKGHNGKRMLLYRKYAVVYSRKEAEQHLKNYLEWCEDSGKKGNFF